MNLPGWQAHRPGEIIDLDNADDLEQLAAHRLEYLKTQLFLAQKNGAHQDPA